MFIDKLIDDIIVREGGYVDHPDDRGGPTCWGITQAVARDHGFNGPMRQLPKDVARKIYRDRYYVKPGFNRVSAHSLRVAEEMTDTGVNMGTRRSAQFLQAALNALNRGGSDYPDLTVDGDIGPATLSALQKYMMVRDGKGGEMVLLKALNCLQGAKYLEIAERDHRQESFVYGWLAHRVVL